MTLIITSTESSPTDIQQTHPDSPSAAVRQNHKINDSDINSQIRSAESSILEG